jgi:hypothetical protein
MSFSGQPEQPAVSFYSIGSGRNIPKPYHVQVRYRKITGLWVIFSKLEQFFCINSYHNVIFYGNICITNGKTKIYVQKKAIYPCLA